MGQHISLYTRKDWDKRDISLLWKVLKVHFGGKNGWQISGKVELDGQDGCKEHILDAG